MLVLGLISSQVSQNFSLIYVSKAKIIIKPAFSLEAHMLSSKIEILILSNVSPKHLKIAISHNKSEYKGIWI